METLRFLFTTTFYPPYHIGGDAVHVEYLAEELAKIGHEIHVFHSLDAYKLKRKTPSKNVEHDGVHTHQIQTPFNSSAYVAHILGNSSYVTRKFKALVEETKPDVVHHHNISLLGYSILKKQRNYLNLYTAHDYWLICQHSNLWKNRSEICESASCFFCALRCRRPLQLWRHRKEFGEAVRDVDVLIAPSSYVKNRVSQSLKVKTVIMPNFAPEPPNPIEPSGFTDFFLYVGLLEKHKGILGLINVYKELVGEIGKNLVIAGDGSLEDKIRGFIRKNKLDDEITLLGWIDHGVLYRLLKDANALIIPSIGLENCPLIALEALSVGTPIIASNNGGLPEIVEKIDKDLIYASIDELKKILTNFGRKRYSRCAIKTIFKKYYSKAYIENYLELIRSQVLTDTMESAFLGKGLVSRLGGA